MRRRVTAIWSLLFFNVLAFNGGSLLPIPRPIAQMMTMGALGVALVLVLDLNRAMRFHPSVVLALYTLLAVLALTAGVRGTAGVGAVVRSVRFLGFLSVLWLLTPYWGRRDLLLVRCHLLALSGVCSVVLLGLLIAPGAALGGPNGRLVGTLWPIPGPQVGQYAAVAAGTALMMWLSERLSGRIALAVVGVGVVMLLLSQTRTALLALIAATASGTATLVLARRRARRIVMAAAVFAPVAFAALAPAFIRWFQRDQSSAEISNLTGRRQVWERLLDQPRATFETLFGSGLSDKSFGGLPIDSGWLAAYHEQGLVGVVLVACVLSFLLLAPLFSRAGPGRALATFLVVYCAVSSYTEVGVADASPYVLHLVVAASLITPLRDHSGQKHGMGAAT